MSQQYLIHIHAYIHRLEDDYQRDHGPWSHTPLGSVDKSLIVHADDFRFVPPGELEKMVYARFPDLMARIVEAIQRDVFGRMTHAQDFHSGEPGPSETGEGEGG